MKKKIFALVMAAVMLFACAMAASAAESTLPDVDSPAFWQGHSAGVEITKEGVEITFKATTYENAEDLNWMCPMVVVYAGDEAKVNGEGYLEYWVERTDVWGWGNPAYYGNPVDAGDNAANMEPAGITHTGDLFPDWAEYRAALKAGTDCKVTAKLTDGKVTLVTEAAGAKSTAVFPVEADKTTYISLFGDHTKLTDIKVKTNDPVVEPAPEVKPEKYTVHVNIAATDWESAQVWAWGGKYGEICSDWSKGGIEMHDDGDGWYSIEFTNEIEGFLFRDASGKQTGNVDVSSPNFDEYKAEAWYTVSEDLNYTVVWEDPNAPSKTADTAEIALASVVMILAVAGMGITLGGKKKF